MTLRRRHRSANRRHRRTPDRPGAGPGDCFTNEGYGRYWPCGAGRSGGSLSQKCAARGVAQSVPCGVSSVTAALTSRSSQAPPVLSSAT